MYCIMIVFLLFLPWTLHSVGIKRSVMMYVVEQEVNGAAFTHRIDTIDGKRKEVWVIQGKQVSEDEYFDRIAQEEALEHKRQRQKEVEKVRQQQNFIAQEQYALVKKLLRYLVDDIEKNLRILDDMRLAPYLAFKKESFASQEALDEFIHNQLAQAKRLVNNHDESEILRLQDMYNELITYPDKINAFYQDTLHQARERSDDTRLLKDLLHLVSERASQ